MKTVNDLTTGAQTRSFATRTATSEPEGVLRGIAVPYEDPITLWPGLREQFAPGAVIESDGLLFWRHDEPIGVITETADTPAGWEITARISDTQLGRDAKTLLADGAVRSLSIGFEPLEHLVSEADDGTTTITHTKVRAREVSIVPHPAYPAAAITEHREETNMTTPSASEIQIREQLTDIERRLDTIASAATAPIEVTDRRTPGEFLRALASGDPTTVEAYNAMLTRSYTGMTTEADHAKPAWTRDLLRLIEAANPLAALFATSPLPASGMSIEYGEIKSNTIQVAKQANEGDTLATGKIDFQVKNAPVETFGGYVELSRQVIERSSAPVLDTALRAQAIAAGQNMHAAMAAFYTTIHTAQKATSKIVIAAQDKWTNWVTGIIDAAQKFTQLGLSLDGIIADKATFTALAQFADSTTRPLFALSGPAVNAVGELSVRDGRGNLLSVPVYLHATAPTGEAAFFNRDAIRRYESPLARLQDENILNLTKQFSVYQYRALAAEIPDGIVPITKA